MSGMGAVRRAGLRFCLSVGGMTVALLLAELLVGFLAPQQLVLIRPDIWYGIDGVGWRMRANLDTHLAPAGHRLVADALVEPVESLLERPTGDR